MGKNREKKEKIVPETKICKHCQSEIPYSAKICPNCRKKQSKKKGLIALLVIVIIIVIIAIAAAAGGGSSDSTTTDTGQQEQAATNESAKKDAESAAAEDGLIKKGDSFEANGLKVTVNDIVVGFTDYDDEYGMYDLEDGKEYAMADFTFENTGKSDAYVSIYDFDCYADNTACEQQYIGDDDFINTNLSSGRTVSFKTYYAVPKDAKSIELEYTANIWTDEKVKVKLK